MSEEPYTGRLISEATRRHAIQAIVMADDGMEITIRKPKRSSEQNRKMWAVLTQLEPVDWYGQTLTKEEWKIVITASLKRQRAVPGIDGGFVVLGEQTRNMSSAEINQVIEAAYALGVHRGVKFMETENIEYRISRERGMNKTKPPVTGAEFGEILPGPTMRPGHAQHVRSGRRQTLQVPHVAPTLGISVGRKAPNPHHPSLGCAGHVSICEVGVGVEQGRHVVLLTEIGGKAGLYRRNRVAVVRPVVERAGVGTNGLSKARDSKALREETQDTGEGGRARHLECLPRGQVLVSSGVRGAAKPKRSQEDAAVRGRDVFDLQVGSVSKCARDPVDSVLSVQRFSDFPEFVPQRRSANDPIIGGNVVGGHVSSLDDVVETLHFGVCRQAIITAACCGFAGLNDGLDILPSAFPDGRRLGSRGYLDRGSDLSSLIGGNNQLASDQRAPRIRGRGLGQSGIAGDDLAILDGPHVASLSLDDDLAPIFQGLGDLDHRSSLWCVILDTTSIGPRFPETRGNRKYFSACDTNHRAKAEAA